MFYNLKYFLKSDNSFCAIDFDNKEKIETINISFILSISDLQMYKLPFSGEEVGNYSIVVMSNNDTFYIKENSFKELQERIGNPT
jgi:hypothetical protein